MIGRSTRAGLLTLLAVFFGAVAGAKGQSPNVIEGGVIESGVIEGGVAGEHVEVGGGDVLDLREVIASVQTHHPRLRSARQGVVAAEGEQLAAEGGFDLNLSASGIATPQGYYDWGRADIAIEQPTALWGASFYAGWRIGRGGDIPDYYGQYRTLDFGELRAGLRVPLWRDGPIDSRRARLWRAEHGIEAERSRVDTRMLEMRFGGARAYWRWVAAGRKYRIASDLLGLAERRDGQINMRVHAGAIAPIVALENRRVILRRRTSLIAARRSLEAAAIALSLYYRDARGRPRRPDPSRIPSSIEGPPPIGQDISAQIQTALSRRPELRRYEALLRRQRVSVELAENTFAPRIDLTLGGSLDIGPGAEGEQEVLGTPVLEGGVRISLPLQFRAARGAIERSRAELASMNAEMQLQGEQIMTQVQDTNSAVQAALDGANLARQSAEVALAVAVAERQRFELGASELFVVNLREQAAAEAQSLLVDAETALQVAHMRWRRVMASELE